MTMIKDGIPPQIAMIAVERAKQVREEAAMMRSCTWSSCSLIQICTCCVSSCPPWTRHGGCWIWRMLKSIASGLYQPTKCCWLTTQSNQSHAYAPGDDQNAVGGQV